MFNLFIFYLVPQSLLWFFPKSIRIWILNKFYGWNIENSTEIGFSFFFQCRDIRIGCGTQIGHLNVFKQIDCLDLGKNVWIGNLNFFSGNAYHEDSWKSSIVIGKNSQIMSRHFFDMGGGITIGDDVVFAGRCSHVWAHSIDIVDKKRVFRGTSVNIGNSAYICSQVTIICSDIPDNALVAACSVVNRALDSMGRKVLIAGNPAVVKKIYND